MNRARFVGTLVLTVAVAGITIACASTPDTSRVTEIYTADASFQEFAGGGALKGVNQFLAARCATLDCHGQIGRPLRLFSEFGLRLVDEAGDYSGGAPTTEAEIFANYTAAISVQPELTSEVFAGVYDPHVLLLLRKPLQLERHKGGQVLYANDYGDLCLTSWLSGLGVDYSACADAAAIP